MHKKVQNAIGENQKQATTATTAPAAATTTTTRLTSLEQFFHS